MAGKAKETPRDKAIALRLPTELYDKIKEAAGGRSISQEIRARLERSLSPADPETREAIEAIRFLLARQSVFEGERWHDNPFFFAAARIAVLYILDHYRPEGETELLGDDRGAKWVGHLALDYVGALARSRRKEKK